MEVTRAELSRQLDVTKPYITKLVKKGTLTFNDKGLIDLDVAKKAIEDAADPTRAYKKKTNNNIQDSDEDDIQFVDDDGEVSVSRIFNLDQEKVINNVEGMNYTESRTKNEQAKLIKNIIDQKIALKKLVEKKDVEMQAFAIGKVLREGLLLIPARISAQLAAETDEQTVFKIIEKEIKEKLNEALIQLTTMEF